MLHNCQLTDLIHCHAQRDFPSCEQVVKTRLFPRTTSSAASPPAAPHSLPKADRPAAAAAHRAALRDVDVDIGAVDNGSGVSRYDQARGCSPICVTGISAIGVSLLYCDKTYRLYSAIGNFDSFDDSRLWRNFASCRCVAQCKALTIGHSFGLERFPCAKGIKRSSALSASARQPQTARLVFKSLLFAGCAAKKRHGGFRRRTKEK